LDFQLEGDTYRALRIQKPGKTGILELQLAVGDGEWKTLTESTQRQTQVRLETLLRMNYETFINASFLLQGRADEFTVKRPGERKRILGELLGVGYWERYREESARRRREKERELDQIDGRLSEIESELEQEPDRERRLLAAKAEHRSAIEQREKQEKLVQTILAYHRDREQLQTRIKTLAEEISRTRGTLKRLETSLADRQTEQKDLLLQVNQAQEIEARYSEWLTVSAELKRWESKAVDWNRLNRELQEARHTLDRERDRLEQLADNLERRQRETNERLEKRTQTQSHLDRVMVQVADLKERLTERETLSKEMGELQGLIGALTGEQPRLRQEMQEMKARQVQLQSEESGRCPLCDQPLTMEHRAAVIVEIEEEGKALGDRFREIKTTLEKHRARLQHVQNQLTVLEALERDLRGKEREETTATTQIAEHDRALVEWEETGAPQLATIRDQLEQNIIAPEAAERIIELEASLQTLNYDSEAHTTSRYQAEQLADYQEAYRRLGEARAALRPLETALEDLSRQIRETNNQLDHLVTQEAGVQSELTELGPEPPFSSLAAERELNRMREAEVMASKAVGAAEQNLKALGRLRDQKVDLAVSRQDVAETVGHLKILERAFGRNGVQALLIEQALPIIEERANDLLDRLTGGEMRVTFSTQRQLKSRDALAETLDIHIRDRRGDRPYEMYSGGEAFRVNFAIRIALSRLLAQRAGARLQTLVVDEGFGSQDPEGRQRLIEAINMIQTDFATVLVITHIDELKDAFPVRIEVTKGSEGSQIRVE
jgi:exonuclease SbcC